MNLNLCLTLSLTAIFAGLTSGTFLSAIIKACRKKSISRKVTAAILFLSLTIAFLAFSLVISGNLQQIQNSLLKDHFYLILFAASIVFGFFLKYLFIPFVLIYIFASVFVNISISKIAIPSDSQISINVKDASPLEFRLLTFSDKVLFPVKRSWIQQTSEASLPPALKFLKPSLQTLTIKIPEETLFPATFNLQIKENEKTFSPVLKKTL